MLRVHFLNVGHGDCTVIKHPSGRLTMIDVNSCQQYDRRSEQTIFEEELLALQRAGGGGAYGLLTALKEREKAYELVNTRAKRELTDPINFMKRMYPGQSLFRFILTHPDLDHMRGLRRLHEEIGFFNFWDTANDKSVTSFRSEADKIDWAFYQDIRSAGGKMYTQGDSLYAFAKEWDGRPGGDSIEILSPTREIVGICNTNGRFNDISLVIRVHHASRSVLLPGDVEAATWDSMVMQHGYRLKSCFLKASHHGRDSGYHSQALRLINPEMTFVSVGQKPATDASSKYRQQCPKVASTRFYGDIELRVHNNGQYEWFVNRNAGR